MLHWIFRHRLTLRKTIGRLDHLRPESSLQKAIVGSALQTDPYPHFVTENVLPESVLSAAQEHWPQRSDFQPEIAHNYILELLSKRISDRRKREFWDDFSKKYGREMAAAAADQFRPWIAARYGDGVNVKFARVSLMESDPAYSGHGCHTHHYHDPSWVGTLLLYLDKDATGYPGTTIQRYAATGVEDQAKMAARTLQWFNAPGFSEATTVEYKQNRLFAFMDSSISYHSVHAADPGAVGHRRIFRIHLRVRRPVVAKAYGVPFQQLVERRRQPTDDPQVVGWLAKEIGQLEEQSRKLNKAG